MGSIQASNQPYAVEVKPSAAVGLLWIVMVLLLVGGVVFLIKALASQDTQAFVAGLAALLLAVLLLGFATVIERLVSIDAHIRVLVARSQPRV